LGWSTGSQPPASQPLEFESQQRPRSPSPFQFHHRHHSQTPPRPATAASYCSSSSGVLSSSSSFLNAELSPLVIQHHIAPFSQPITTQGTQPSRLNYERTRQNRPTTAESHHSSSSDLLGSTSSLNDELSQLVIQHDEPPSSQFTTVQNTQPSRLYYHSTLRDRSTRAGSYHSSSSDLLGSTSSLNDELSQLVIQHDEPPSSQFTTVQSTQRSPQSDYHNRQVLRPSTPASYYSSSSEVLSSAPDSVDEELSRLVIKEDTPQSSQSTNQGTQSSQLKPLNIQPTQYSDSDSSAPTTPLRQREASSQRYFSPSSTGKLSVGYPSPIQSAKQSTPLSVPVGIGRLYRTRSGNLVTAVELRQRKEREQELLDVVLSGVMVSGKGKAKVSSQRSITMALDESGRWRIGSICEPWGP
jgi:hypothetical protein